MESSEGPSTFGALGLRFKAGLQSVLGNRVKSPPKINGLSATKDHLANVSAGFASSVKPVEVSTEVGDALLGESEQGDEEVPNESEEALLGGDEHSCGDSFQVPSKDSTANNIAHPADSKVDSVESKSVGSDNPTDATPPQSKFPDASTETTNDFKQISSVTSNHLPDNNDLTNIKSKQSMTQISKSCKTEDETGIKSDDGIDQAEATCKPLPKLRDSMQEVVVNKDSSSAILAEVDGKDLEPRLKETDSNLSPMDTGEVTNGTISSESNADITPNATSLRRNSNDSSTLPENSKTFNADACKSPSTMKRPRSYASQRSHTPPVDNELEYPDQKLNDSCAPLCLDVQNAMDDLLGKTVAKVDGNPVTNVCEYRASPHVSPNHSDDECGDLLIGATSAEEMSEDDSRDDVPAKKIKLSSPAPSGRLNKLISHLSTALEEDNRPSVSKAYTEQEELNADPDAIHLQKNGLASFYDVIIKKDVIKEDYHKDLTRRHSELQIKSNMGCRKITKILQEVKGVREKLKSMSVRPAQRSVSTQIFLEKLQTAPEQSGNMIVKSRVLSQKALIEQQRKAAEARQKAEDLAREAIMKQKEMERLAAIDMLKKIPSNVQSPPFTAPLSAVAPRATNLRTIAPRVIAPQTISAVTPPAPLARMPFMPTPLSSTPLTSRPSGPTSTHATAMRAPPKPLLPKPSSTEQKHNEVIDLTSEEDDAAGKAGSAAKQFSNPLGAANGLNHLNANSTRKSLHPAPLPATPLTGKPCLLLKPASPRLDLSSKEDGIVLQWNMHISKNHAKIATYQIFGYKEKPGPLTGSEWKKVGDLKALPLPMACTLTQFQTGHIYHFAVRAVDEFGRTGDFGTPRSTNLA